VQEGRGPDLLLVHGLGSSVVCWASVFAELKTQYRVTALDLAGFGRSDMHVDRDYTLDGQTKRLAEFIDALKLDRPFVVAHSMGAAICAWLAHSRPGVFQKLLLLSPALNHRIVAFNPGLFTWLARPTGQFLASPALVRWLYTKRTLYKIPPNVDELVEEYCRPYKDNFAAVEIFLRHAHLIRDKRLPDALAEFKTPTRIIVGAKDVIFPQRYLKRFSRLNPQIEVVVTPECGHQIMEEHPQVLLNHITEFLR